MLKIHDYKGFPNPARVRIIPRGIDLDRFNPAKVTEEHRDRFHLEHLSAIPFSRASPLLAQSSRR